MASQELSELRLVLIGKVGAVKSSVMNTFVSSSEECENPASECQKIFVPGTEKCQRQEVKIRGQKLVVIDTPGLCSAEKKDEEVVKEIKECVSLADPGPHVFLFVLSCLDRFTEEEQEMVKIIKETFDKQVLNHTMALFTHADKLKGKKIQDFIKENEDLERFVSECKGGCHPFDSQDQDRVFSLLESIRSVVQENGGKHYTTDMLPKAVNKGLMKKIAISVNSSGVAGAVLGGTVSHFVGSPVGVAVGAVAGGAAGITVGGAGILAAEHMKAKTCMIQ